MLAVSRDTLLGIGQPPDSFRIGIIPQIRYNVLESEGCYLCI